VAAYFRGGSPSEQVWSSTSDQVLTLSLYFTQDISHDDCSSRFANRPYLGRVYVKNGELNKQIETRYQVLIDLIQKRPDLIEGGGDLRRPADPTYTACRLTEEGCHLAHDLIASFPPTPDFPNWPDRRASPE